MINTSDTPIHDDEAAISLNNSTVSMPQCISICQSIHVATAMSKKLTAGLKQ